jgi:hypothetical protein
VEEAADTEDAGVAVDGCSKVDMMDSLYKSRECCICIKFILNPYPIEVDFKAFAMLDYPIWQIEPVQE